jgi:hypothetical protein
MEASGPIVFRNWRQGRCYNDGNNRGSRRACRWRLRASARKRSGSWILEPLKLVSGRCRVNCSLGWPRSCSVKDGESESAVGEVATLPLLRSLRPRPGNESTFLLPRTLALPNHIPLFWRLSVPPAKFLFTHILISFLFYLRHPPFLFPFLLLDDPQQTTPLQPLSPDSSVNRPGGGEPMGQYDGVSSPASNLGWGWNFPLGGQGPNFQCSP